MTTTATPSPTRRLLGVSLEAIVATLLGGFLTLACSLAAYSLLDVSLGTIFAAVFLCGLVAIGMAQVVTNALEWVVVAVAITLASTIPILLGLFDNPDLAGAAGQLLLLCLTLAAASIAMRRALARVCGQGVAGAGVAVFLIAWLTWPVWMSPYFDSRVGTFFVDHLLAHQPLFALNGPYRAMGDWTHAPLAYERLTNLGQDIMFAPPTHAWRAIVSHAVVAGVFGVLAFVGTPASPAKTEDPVA